MNQEILMNMDIDYIPVQRLMALLETFALKHAAKMLPDLLETVDNEPVTSSQFLLSVLESELKGRNERLRKRDYTAAHFPPNILPLEKFNPDELESGITEAQIMGEDEGVSLVIKVDTKTNSTLPRCWRSNDNKPNRYNEDGSLKYGLVLVCLCHIDTNKKIPRIAKYKNSSLVDENNILIESDKWKVTHWTTLTPSPYSLNEKFSNYLEYIHISSRCLMADNDVLLWSYHNCTNHIQQR